MCFQKDSPRHSVRFRQPIQDVRDHRAALGQGAPFRIGKFQREVREHVLTAVVFGGQKQVVFHMVFANTPDRLG